MSLIHNEKKTETLQGVNGAILAAWYYVKKVEKSFFKNTMN